MDDNAEGQDGDQNRGIDKTHDRHRQAGQTNGQTSSSPLFFSAGPSFVCLFDSLSIAVTEAVPLK